MHAKIPSATCTRKSINTINTTRDITDAPIRRTHFQKIFSHRTKKKKKRNDEYIKK